MRFPLLLATLWLGLQALPAQDTLTVEEAISRHLVQVALKGNGGFRGPVLHIWFKNLSNQPLALLVPPGQQFASSDSNQQDLIITAPAMVTVPARAVEARDLYTMCTQSYHHSPKRGEVFTPNGMATEPLLTVVQAIAEGNYQNSTAQSAVWATANRGGYRDVFGMDSDMVHTLAGTISEATGVPMSEFEFTPRPHVITNINSSFEALVPEHLEEASLRLYTPEGDLYTSYFEGRAIERGYHQWKVGINHTLDSSAELRLVLAEGDQVIAARTVRRGDTVKPLHRYHSEVVLSFDLARQARAEVGIYDEAGQLYFLVQEGKVLPAGRHRRRVIVGKDLPRDRPYFVQSRAGETVLHSLPLDPEAPEPQRHEKRRLRGSVTFQIETTIQGGRLGIYNQEGQLKRLLYDIPRLNAGTKRFDYQFEHVDGPDAVFYLRLLDGSGTVVAEEEIR
jgi:hypothetical protein